MKTFNSIILLSAIMMFISLNTFAQTNYALQLDGENDYIGVNDNAVLNPTDALTLEAWINAEYWESNIWAGSIIGKQNTSPDRGYCLTAGENGRAEFTVSIGESWKAVNTGQIMGLGTWYHIAGVFDGSTSKIYINGVLQSSIDISGTHDDATGTSIRIGDNPTWTGRNFQGIVDEIRIWNIARTESEIQENLATELTGSETGLVAYWKMNDGPGSTTASDETANGNDGILINMDENTDWVAGFEPPTDDVGVLSVVSPYSLGPDLSNEEYVKLEIKNFTTEAVSNFDISYEPDGGDPVTETYTGTIEAFGTYVYTFSSPLDLSGQGSFDIKAYTGLSGDSNNSNDTVNTTITPSESVMLFDDVQHSFGSAGQTQYRTLSINEDLSDYSEILLYIDLNCPGTGCDPWDQPAFMYLMHEGEKYELARYITPYGVPCGGWVFDITDFKSILKGNAQFMSYIQVWGTSGWLLDARIELVPGTPAYESSKVDRLCIEEYWVYGDLAVNPHSPDANTITIDPDANAVKIRMTTTGHGQGNTDNAAEFKNVTHEIWLNDAYAFSQHLWKDDCADNECSPQSGTYTYSRAGWCPGQDVQPWEWDLNGYYTPGEDLSFEYRLQDYTNLLNTGYNGSSHTEPHYKIHTYLITYFNPLTDIYELSKTEKGINVFPNPTSDHVNIQFHKNIPGIISIELYNIYGQLVLNDNLKNINAEEVYKISMRDLSNGLYTVKIKSEKEEFSRKLIINKQ
jgi:hypothetical protein